RLALELAKKVRETGQEAVLDAMPPAERRVIHLALVNEPGVTTYSEGEEPDRHIVISPID
ncbi:MAG: R3H domain-containing nucleic acid-binding protein, partial [Armatimonadota bacterium]